MLSVQTSHLYSASAAWCAKEPSEKTIIRCPVLPSLQCRKGFNAWLCHVVVQVLARTCQRVVAIKKKNGSAQRVAQSVVATLEAELAARSTASHGPREDPPMPSPQADFLASNHSFSEQIADSPCGEQPAEPVYDPPLSAAAAPVRACRSYSGLANNLFPEGGEGAPQGQVVAPTASTGACPSQSYQTAGLQAAVAGAGPHTSKGVTGAAPKRKKKVSYECGVRFKTFTLLKAVVYRFHSIPGGCCPMLYMEACCELEDMLCCECQSLLLL